MKIRSASFLGLSLAVISFVVLLPATASAQIIHGNYTNTGVTYLNVTESGPGIPPSVFTPPSPATSYDTLNMVSQLSFVPNNFIQTDQSLSFDLKTKQSQLQINIQANPGMWFTGNALQLETAGSYNLVAPFGSPPLPLTPGGATNSYAYASSTAAYTLMVTEVDNAPFIGGSLLTNTVVITPSSLASVGPGGSASGSWSGSTILDINTIKLHFGIGATNKVTGMVLQYSAQVAAAGVYGQATTSLMNLNVVNQVVPEPSTYALLLMGAGALGYCGWRRRRRN